jgi:hypothetical protein
MSIRRRVSSGNKHRERHNDLYREPGQCGMLRVGRISSVALDISTQNRSLTAKNVPLPHRPSLALRYPKWCVNSARCWWDGTIAFAHGYTVRASKPGTRMSVTAEEDLGPAQRRSRMAPSVVGLAAHKVDNSRSS